MLGSIIESAVMKEESMQPPDPELLALGRWVIGATEFMRISPARHADLDRSMTSLRAMVAFEENFASLLDNMIDFELYLLRISVSDCVRWLGGPHERSDHRRALNRHLANVLSTCRQYLDHSHKHVAHLIEPPEPSFASRTNKAYDNSLAYRAMELLRNYVQHQDAGIHTMWSNSKWLDMDDQDRQRMQFGTCATLDIDRLASTADFSAKQRAVLAELRNQPHEADVGQLLRRYVADLSSIHEWTRKRMEQPIHTRKELLRAAHQEYVAAFPDVEMVGLCVMLRPKEPPLTKLLDLPLGIIDRLEHLQKVNRCPTNLHKRFVTSEFSPRRWR